MLSPTVALRFFNLLNYCGGVHDEFAVSLLAFPLEYTLAISAAMHDGLLISRDERWLFKYVSMNQTFVVI